MSEKIWHLWAMTYCSVVGKGNSYLLRVIPMKSFVYFNKNFKNIKNEKGNSVIYYKIDKYGRNYAMLSQKKTLLVTYIGNL